jgi:hypothetical protein
MLDLSLIDIPTTVNVMTTDFTNQYNSNLTDGRQKETWLRRGTIGDNAFNQAVNQ